MSCGRFEAAVLDEGLPRPEGLAVHLASCAACRSLRRAHARALRLRGATPLAPRARLTAGARRGLAALAFLAASGAVTAAAFGVTVKVSHGRETPPAAAPFRVERPEPLPVAAAPSEEAQEWAALAALRDEVAAPAHRDLLVADETYARFGALPRWVAPRTTQPSRALYEAGALHPVVYTPED